MSPLVKKLLKCFIEKKTVILDRKIKRKKIVFKQKEKHHNKKTENIIKKIPRQKGLKSNFLKKKRRRRNWSLNSKYGNTLFIFK